MDWEVEVSVQSHCNPTYTFCRNPQQRQLFFCWRLSSFSRYLFFSTSMIVGGRVCIFIPGSSFCGWNLRLLHHNNLYRKAEISHIWKIQVFVCWCAWRSFQWTVCKPKTAVSASTKILLDWPWAFGGQTSFRTFPKRATIVGGMFRYVGYLQQYLALFSSIWPVFVVFAKLGSSAITYIGHEWCMNFGILKQPPEDHPPAWSFCGQLLWSVFLLITRWQILRLFVC